MHEKTHHIGLFSEEKFKTHFPQTQQNWICIQIFTTEENVHLPPLNLT